jgi:hypothetical protein
MVSTCKGALAERSVNEVDHTCSTMVSTLHLSLAFKGGNLRFFLDFNGKLIWIRGITDCSRVIAAAALISRLLHKVLDCCTAAKSRQGRSLVPVILDSWRTSLCWTARKRAV